MRLVTYNLLHDHPKFANVPAKNWAQRRPHVIAHLRALAPALLATQEGRPSAIADLQTAFPEWTYYGEPAGGPHGGEQVGWWYAAAQFERVGAQTFWLSPTPDEPSAGWGAAHHRVCGHVLLRTRQTGALWACFNTHLDHRSEAARQKGAALILARMAAVQTAYPEAHLVLTGDFNANLRSSVYAFLHDHPLLEDAFYKTQQKIRSPQHTFSGVDARWTWQRLALHLFYPRYMRQRIDHIWVSSLVAVQRYAISDWTYAKGRYYPSDHLPVLVDLIGA